MPVSVMKFLTIKASATEYKMTCFKFGGGFFASKGYGKYDYVAGILLGPNASLIISDTFCNGLYAVEMAGHLNANDLAAAWEYIARNFDKLPLKGVLNLEQNADDKYQWIVESVQAEEEVI